MSLPEDRLQQIIEGKDVENAVYGEGWAIIDGAMIIYDTEDPPSWFPQELDDDGNTPEYAKKLEALNA